MIWYDMIWYLCVLLNFLSLSPWTEATLPGQVLSTVQILWQGFNEPTALRGACHIKATPGPLLLELLPSSWWRSSVMFLSQLSSCNTTLISSIALLLCLNNFANAPVAPKLGHCFDWSQTPDPSLMVLTPSSLLPGHTPNLVLATGNVSFWTPLNHTVKQTNKQITQNHALSSSLSYSWVWSKHFMHCPWASFPRPAGPFAFRVLRFNHQWGGILA